MKIYHEIGDRIELEMPASEVCMHMKVTGKRMAVEILLTCAQLYNDDGTPFSFAIGWGEAGIYSDGSRPYTHEQRKNSRGQIYEPREFLVHTPDGKQYGRDASYESCKAAARLLGKGAKVEGLDDMLNRTGDYIYEVK